VSQAWSAGQSLAASHPHRPLPKQAVPDVLPMHETHAALVPQAACDVPGAHVPPLQHPLLHGSIAEHVAPQVPVFLSQAWPEGQSPTPVQPHSPLARQAAPEGFPAHEMQAAPVAPQAILSAPDAQVPRLQQPPLHG
jgi:hypothetical protein